MMLNIVFAFILLAGLSQNVLAQNFCSSLFDANKSVHFLSETNSVDQLIGKHGDFYFNQDLLVRGKLVSVSKDVNGEVAYYSLSGPVEILYLNKVMPGQDIAQHAHGFGNPLGAVKSIQINGKITNRPDLSAINFERGDDIKMIYHSGVEVTGIFSHVDKRAQKNVIMTFMPESCEVVDAQRNVLFDRSWGIYDLVLEKQFSTAVITP